MYLLSEFIAGFKLSIIIDLYK